MLTYCRKLEVGVPSCPHTLLILIPLEAADMHSVHCKYGIPCFSTLHSHGNFSFQVTKVLSVTECFRFVELLSVFTAPFKISSMISVATILRKQVKSAPNQIGPKSNRPQIKSAPSQIGPIFVAYYCQHAKLNSLNTIQQNI